MDTLYDITIINKFTNDEGKITTWPSKKTAKIEILKYLSTKFIKDKEYNEKEVNNIINCWHTFNDYFLLRRGLVDYKLINRTRDGSKYWI